MLTFNVTTAGQSLLNAATPGSNPVLIDSIVLSGTGSFSSVSPVTNFAGAVVAADSDVGDYVVVAFDDTVANNSYTIQQISLKSGSTVLANSEAVSITKVNGKPACFRISCQFAGASKCAFQNISINMPHASKTRDGVIRLAVSSDETHKDRTVYSAADVEALIEAGINGSNKYVPWNVSSGEPVEGSTTVSHLTVVDDYTDGQTAVTFHTQYNSVDNVTYLYIDGPTGGDGAYIIGSVVTSSPTISSGSLVGSQTLVNEDYISELYSNSVTETTTSNPTNKLVSGAAVDTYVTNKLSSIDGNYVHIDGAETVTGAKTFSAATVFSTSVSSPSYIGTGVYSTYAANTWSNSSNNAKLPTVATVRSAISAADSAVTIAFQTADSGLQSQIDALNAGQNLADIVATKSALDTLGITDIQVGDKVQVLADETHDGASTVYNLTSTSPKTWAYIGKYGQDSYTKSEADNLFVENSQIKQSVDSTKQDEIPSNSAVSTYVTSQLNTLANIYVKLNSNSTQSINSALDITGQVDIDDVTIANNTVSSSGGNYGGFKLLGNDRAAVLSYNNGSDDIAFIELDGVYHNLAVNLGEASNASFEIARTVGAPDTYSVTGEAVADYSDANLNAPVDGRLVTVDYLSSYTGDMSAYVKKTSSTAQNISSDLSITGDVDITGSLDVDNVSINGFEIIGSYVNTSGNQYSYKLTTHSPGESAFYIEQTSGANTVASITLNGPGHASIYNGVHSIDFNSIIDDQPIPYVGGSFVASYLDINGALLEDGRLTTVDYVNNKLQSISAENAVGSIGLFLYTEVGNQKSYGEFVNGAYLKPVGMSLPISGQISYKAVATNNALSGKWKLLSVAMKRTATDPCLVLAQKVDNTYSA